MTVNSGRQDYGWVTGFEPSRRASTYFWIPQAALPPGNKESEQVKSVSTASRSSQLVSSSFVKLLHKNKVTAILAGSFVIDIIFLNSKSFNKYNKTEWNI